MEKIFTSSADYPNCYIGEYGLVYSANGDVLGIPISVKKTDEGYEISVEKSPKKTLSNT